MQVTEGRKVPRNLQAAWCDQAEAMSLLGVSRTTLFEMRRSGIIESRRYEANGMILVKKASIDRYLKSQSR